MGLIRSAVSNAFKSKCFMCRVPMGKNMVPKDVRMSDRSWKQVCPSCFKTLGGRPRTNIAGDADHNPK